MKKITNTLILAAVLPISVAFAQQKMDTMKPMDMSNKPAAMTQMTQMTHKAVGVVKNVNPKAGVVTLAHEAVNSMNWPPMTMGFKVKDKTLLAKLKEGRKVEFEFVQEDDDYVVTKVK